MDTWAVITVTKSGIRRALKIREQCEDNITFDIYTLNKYYVHGVHQTFTDMGEMVSKAFKTYKTLLFIMATGIVVRTIAPLIVSKTSDPAVLVMDDSGKFVISLLSGHIGRGNERALRLCEYIEAVPVITTSSDVNHKMAVDLFAQSHGLVIRDLKKAKDITARILNDEKIGVVLEEDVNLDRQLLSSNVDVLKDLHRTDEYDGAILISVKNEVDINLPYVQLIPRNIVVGIGCKRNVPGEAIIDFIVNTLERLNISTLAACSLATVDIKKDEVGILNASKHFNLPIKVISRGDIAAVQDRFSQSSFVKKAIGVGNVCESCGYIASGKGECLLEKTAYRGITISVWKKREEELLDE